LKSKYTISSKQTNFNNAITKAIQHLNEAEKIIYQNPQVINNEFVKKEVKDFKVILKLCVFYDDGRDLKKAFKNINDNYYINYLPIFISVSAMYESMSYLKILNEDTYKYNIIENLLRIRNEYWKKNKIIIIDGFNNLTGAITLISI